ncbi:hypothetical protein H8B06_05260 [Sphingobacterium sp. DN00404]|uniref:Fimbrillin family protein n=1 Tax=Sphingobacterium micropteri TaxID=2763501 RepID=A0ABR7YLW6_9SPHI|nr:hypothetical protein [Sphingobacterium micropteri]MBD1432226.1 hypothetical protein [Sphingobacterium micropteri]
MKTNSIRYNTIWCLLLTLFVAISCKNETGVEPIYDGIKMRVSLSSGFTVATGNSGALKSKASTSVATKNTDGKLETQTQIIPLSNGLNIVAKLVPEQQTAPVALKQSAGGGLKAAAQEVKSTLPIGTQYRLLVYNATGNEVKRLEKTVDANSSSFDEFTLDATGTTTNYTFVAYSAGTAALPALAANSTLSSAMVTIGNEKFMHFVETIALGYGANDLEVVLANKLSEITTVLDGQGIGLNSITGVGNFTLKNATHTGGSLKLSDGTVTYTGSAQDKAVSFPAISTGLTEVSSLPTVLARDLTTTSLEVEYIEIAGLGRSESFVVPNVKIEPGVKYNLVLELDKGNCMFNVSPETFTLSNTQAGCRIRFLILFTWFNYSIPQNQCSGGIPLVYTMSWATPNNGETIGRVYEFAPTANAGVVMNITSLDNSFNMAINDPADDQNTANRKIATKEIQFQGTGANGRNVRFAGGGGYHGDGTIPNVWDITNGTADNPVLRVSVSASGVVSITGRKSNSDLTQYPMELFNSTSFNTVTWLTSGTTNNKVTITQTVSGPTYINGQVTGKRIAACN